MKKKFEQLIENHQEELKAKNKTYDIIGFIKLFLVISFCILLYFGFSKDFPILFTALILTNFIALTALWLFHAKLREQLNRLKSLISINEKQLDRIEGNWSSFTDIGAEFIDHDHPYSSDLDIVGRKSLFQFLNSTYTYHGRQTFSNDLLNPSYSKEELFNRQDAITELSQKTMFCNELEYLFSNIGQDSSPELLEVLKVKNSYIKSGIIKFFLKYFPIVLSITFILALIFSLKNLLIAAGLLIVLQLIIWGALMLKTQKYLGSMPNLKKLGAFSRVIDYLKNTDVSSDKLIELQDSLGKSDVSAVRAIKELNSITNRISIRYNGLIFFILNLFLLWDIGCAISLEKWKAKYADFSPQWFSALGEFESLLSFSRFPNVCVNVCLPTLSNSDKKTEAEELGHPLINTSARVNNDFSMDNNIFIISGSNMSGKTTFLRTVGINLILAKAGSYVCAKNMSFSDFEVVTSMRISDDLNEGISTFYAELKRIKTIIESSDKNIMFLIDEIFRGTNSQDRLTGAKTVISKLHDKGVTGIITTHDLELCELEWNFARIKNYNFSEYYKDDKICFDYKMRSGKSNTANAKYLMKMVGIM